MTKSAKMMKEKVQNKNKLVQKIKNVTYGICLLNNNKMRWCQAFKTQTCILREEGGGG